MVARRKIAGHRDATAAGPVPPGWYPDDFGVTRFWDGQIWTDHIAPPPTPDAEDRANQVPMIAGVLAFILVAIGLICSFQTVSLATGMGVVWVGMALAIGGAIAAAAVPHVRTWIQVICIIGALVAAGNAISVNKQLNDRRNEIQQIFNQP